MSSGNLDIPFPDDKVLLDVVFMDHTREKLHIKTYVFDKEINSIHDVGTIGQVMCDNLEGKGPRPEIFMKPVALFKDPFRKGPHKMVLMEFYQTIDTPCDFYTSIGQTPSAGMEREMNELHMKACLYAGIKYAGYMREDGLSQWEYQVGPCEGVEIEDHLIMSRYLLLRIAEIMGVNILMKPKPAKLYESDGHLNFSTNEMREKGGIEHINKAIQILSKSDQGPLLKMYNPTVGVDNAESTKDSQWSPSMEFNFDIGYKRCSVRIPSLVSVNGKGYLEERRPPANIEPFAASEGLVRACILGEFLRENETGQLDVL